MFINLRLKGVFLLWHIASFFEQRQINVRLDIALRPRITVPVPRAADIAAFLDYANTGNALFLKARRGQQSAKARAYNYRLEFLVDRLSLDRRDVGVVVEVRKVAGNFLVLIIAVGAQTLGPFLPLLPA